MASALKRNTTYSYIRTCITSGAHSPVSNERCSIMEYFRKLLCALGVWNTGVDIVGTLPVEIAEIILQKLDPQSLINASQVSRTWMSICKGSSKLRRSTRHHLRKTHHQMNLNLGLRSTKRVTNTVTRVTRMQKDLCQRVSMKGNRQIHQKILCGPTRNNKVFGKTIPSKSYNSLSLNYSTRSLLRLR